MNPGKQNHVNSMLFSTIICNNFQMTIDRIVCNTIADYEQRENRIDILNHRSIQIIQLLDSMAVIISLIVSTSTQIFNKNNNEMMNNNFHKHSALNCMI